MKAMSGFPPQMCYIVTVDCSSMKLVWSLEFPLQKGVGTAPRSDTVRVRFSWIGSSFGPSTPTVLSLLVVSSNPMSDGIFTSSLISHSRVPSLVRCWMVVDGTQMYS